METIYQDLATGNLYVQDTYYLGRVKELQIGDLICYQNDSTYTFTKYTGEEDKSKCIKLRSIQDDYLKTMIAAC